MQAEIDNSKVYLYPLLLGNLIMQSSVVSVYECLRKS